MAWRLTPHTSFVANTTVITAAYENAIQASINDLYNGAYTVKKWHVDGTGDVANAGAAGSLRVSNGVTVDAGGLLVSAGGITASLGSIVATAGGVTAGSGDVLASAGFCIGNRLQADNTRSSATAGAGQSITIGQIWKDTAPVAWCWIETIAGPSVQLGRGANISSIAYTALGRYTVTLVNGAANKICPQATVFDNAAHIATIRLTGHSTTVFEVDVWDAAGAATDPAVGGGVFVVVFGG